MNSYSAHALIDDNVAIDAVLDDLRAAADPGAAAADERRLQVRAYNRWMALLGSRTYPSIDALDPTDPDFGPNGVVVDFTAGPSNPRLAYVGDRLADACRVQAGADIAELPEGSLLARLTDQYREILVNRAPVGFEAEYVGDRGTPILCRGVLMPFSSDDRNIDHLYGVISWKELAPAEDARSLLAQISSVTHATSEAAPPQAPATANTLFEALLAARCDAIEAELAVSAARDALSRALSATYDLVRRAGQTPEMFSMLVTDGGVAGTAAIVRQVFGSGCDEMMVADYAAALDHAERSGVLPGDFIGFLEGHRGGVKGLIRAAAGARIVEGGWADAVRDAIHSGAPQLDGADTRADARDLVLLLARREADGALAVVAPIKGATISERPPTDPGQNLPAEARPRHSSSMRLLRVEPLRAAAHRHRA